MQPVDDISVEILFSNPPRYMARVEIDGQHVVAYADTHDASVQMLLDRLERMTNLTKSYLNPM